jgi:hypothetical protein
MRTSPSPSILIHILPSQRQPAGTPWTKRRSDPTSGTMHTRIFARARTAHARRFPVCRAVCVPKALTRTVKLTHAHAHKCTYTHAPAYTNTQPCRERERERERGTTDRRIYAQTPTHTRVAPRQAPIAETISSTNKPRRLVTVGASRCSESRPVAAQTPHAHARAKDAGMCVSI